ncbi:MAG: hypothetical protein HZB72_04995 [Burkholderiales bacterium]|nr:hypothetical protein [Burkholderiales bacterium]
MTRETAWIEKRLLSDACFAPLLQSRTPAALSDVLKGQVYMVTLPAPPEQHDGIDHTVIVRRADRMAWLHRSGGIAGMAQTVGPVPLAGCLADAPPTAAAR